MIVNLGRKLEISGNPQVWLSDSTVQLRGTTVAKRITALSGIVELEVNQTDAEHVAFPNGSFGGFAGLSVE